MMRAVKKYTPVSELFQSHLFKLSEVRGANQLASRPASDEVCRGEYWSVYRRGGRDVLSYLSGEQGGVEKQIDITAEESAGLAAGSLDADAVIITHGC